ncbi:MAG TPA: Fur family transcriptional regulator [bacterium]|nr:Fur family transcriptional regulator [bacterium]
MGRFSTTQAVAAFRAHGRNITAQRMAVFRALERADGHPTAEGLHGRIRRAVPSIALKTVYAILHELARLRLAAPLPLPGGAVHWEQNTTPHGHLVCDTCRRVVDLPVDPTVLMPLVRNAARGFDVHGASLIVHGRCGACAKG